MSRTFELLRRAEQERAAAQAQQLELQREQLQSQILATSPTSETLAAAVAATAAAPEQNRRIVLETHPSAQDEISKLVHRLFLLPSGQKVVAFAGVDPGDGCTWLTARIADVLANRSARRVCVVDGNFRSPSLNDCFGVANGFGLTDSVLQPGPIGRFARPLRSNFWLISGGSATANGHTFMGSQILRARMTELRAEFDYVLIDAPAVTQTGDAIAWGHLADGIVLVMGANSTHRETARWVAADIAAANVPLLGAVLNKRTFPIPKKVYARL
jgi:polysaccharide biosynthesis transport protein